MSRVKSQLFGVEMGGRTGRTPARSVSEDGHAAGAAAMRGGAPVDAPPSTNRGGTERPVIATVQELQMVMTDTGELKTILVRRPVNEQVAMIDTLRFTVGEETWNRTAGIQLVADEAFIFEASKHLTQVFGFGITRDLKKSRDFYTNAWELGDNYGRFGQPFSRGHVAEFAC